MTVGESVLLVGMLAHAVAFFFAMRANNQKITLVMNDIHKVELATNSMKDHLVEATRAAALLRGEAKGRADLKTEQAAKP